MNAPTPAHWIRLQENAVNACAVRFRSTLSDPPSDAPERALKNGVAEFAQARGALQACLNTYLVNFNAAEAWPILAQQSQDALSALAFSLAIVARFRETHSELSGALIQQIDILCPIWGRLLRNLSGGLLYLVQSGESPAILGQFAVQAVGLAGFRPTVVEGTLRIDASPEPAEKLARFFGV